MADPVELYDDAVEKERQADALKSEASSLKSQARMAEAAMLAEADALDRQASSEAVQENNAEAAALSQQADETRRRARGGSSW